MDRRKLEKLERELGEMRRRAIKASDVQSLAQRLGRKPVKRGKHPMWENVQFPRLSALSIPDHGGKDFPPGTRKSILNQLEDDIAAWNEKLVWDEDLNGSSGDDK